MVSCSGLTNLPWLNPFLCELSKNENVFNGKCLNPSLLITKRWKIVVPVENRCLDFKIAPLYNDLNKD